MKNHPYKNIGIMLDLETLDNVPRSKVAAIAAVAFSWDIGFEVLKQFYVKVRWKHLNQMGRTKSKSTVDFWKKQPKEIQQEVLYSKEYRKLPFEALLDLTSFIRSTYSSYPKAKITVFSHGAGFDLPILTDMYRQYFPKAFLDENNPRVLPWEFWNERCTRTLLSISKELLGKDRSDYLTETNKKKHHPLYDCLEQAEWASGILNELADKVAEFDYRQGKNKGSLVRKAEGFNVREFTGKGAF